MPTESPTYDPPDPDVDSPGDASRVCANCGQVSDGAFCPSCGQKATSLRQPLHNYLRDAFTEYFGIDGRLWTSLRLLLTKPGRLTQDYLAGRRVRHLRPLRLYLTSTLLFFFLLAVLDPVGQAAGLMAGDERADADTVVQAATYLARVDAALASRAANVERLESLVDSLRGVPGLVVTRDSLDGQVTSIDADLDEVPSDTRDAVRELARLYNASRGRALRRLEWQREELSAMAPDSAIRPSDWATAAEIVIPSNDVNINLPAWLPRSQPMERLYRARTSGDRAAALADLARSMIGQIPTVMFLLLPVFALLLKLIYVRHDWYYSEHLVFALHTHAFAFLVFTFAAVLLGFSGGAAWAGLTGQLLVYGIPVYFFVAQKRVYGQGWLKTGGKALLLGWAYGSLLVMGIVLALVLAASL